MGQPSCERTLGVRRWEHAEHLVAGAIEIRGATTSRCWVRDSAVLRCRARAAHHLSRRRAARSGLRSHGPAAWRVQREALAHGRFSLPGDRGAVPPAERLRRSHQRPGRGPEGVAADAWRRRRQRAHDAGHDRPPLGATPTGDRGGGPSSTAVTSRVRTARAPPGGPRPARRPRWPPGGSASASATAPPLLGRGPLGPRPLRQLRRPSDDQGRTEPGRSVSMRPARASATPARSTPLPSRAGARHSLPAERTRAAGRPTRCRRRPRSPRRCWSSRAGPVPGSPPTTAMRAAPDGHLDRRVRCTMPRPSPPHPGRARRPVAGYRPRGRSGDRPSWSNSEPSRTRTWVSPARTVAPCWVSFFVVAAASLRPVGSKAPRRTRWRPVPARAWPAGWPAAASCPAAAAPDRHRPRRSAPIRRREGRCADGGEGGRSGPRHDGALDVERPRCRPDHQPDPHPVRRPSTLAASTPSAAGRSHLRLDDHDVGDGSVDAADDRALELGDAVGQRHQARRRGPGGVEPVVGQPGVPERPGRHEDPHRGDDVGGGRTDEVLRRTSRPGRAAPGRGSARPSLGGEGQGRGPWCRPPHRPHRSRRRRARWSAPPGSGPPVHVRITFSSAASGWRGSTFHTASGTLPVLGLPGEAGRDGRTARR